jgi:hypothetical protein
MISSSLIYGKPCVVSRHGGLAAHLAKCEVTSREIETLQGLLVEPE